MAQQGVISRQVYSRTYQQVLFDEHEVGDNYSVIVFFLFGLILWFVLFSVFFGNPVGDLQSAEHNMGSFTFGTLAIMYPLFVLCSIAHDAGVKIRQ
jgi:hypothetical protein